MEENNYNQWDIQKLRNEYIRLSASPSEHDMTRSLEIERIYLAKRQEQFAELDRELGAVTSMFKPLKLNDINAEPTEIVCKDFLPLIKGALNILAGAGGVGKSTIALRSVLHFLRANEDQRALLIMGEDDKEEIRERIENITKTFLHGADYEVSKYLERMDFITVDNPVNLRFLERVQGSAVINIPLLSEFKEYIKANKIGFVVLDPLKKFHSVDENSNSEMDLLVRDVFLETAGELKIVMLVLHHSSKSKDGNGSRGASTISDTSRIAYKISKSYVMDKEKNEYIENPDMIGKVMISTIKDNKNIFQKFGYKNTMNGVIPLYESDIKEIIYDDRGFELEIV